MKKMKLLKMVYRKQEKQKKILMMVMGWMKINMRSQSKEMLIKVKFKKSKKIF